MWKYFKKFGVAIVSSKKAVACTSGVLLMLGAPLAKKVGWDLTAEEIHWALGVIATYILGQGLADIGKEAAKLG